MTDLLGRADPTADDAHAARAARRTVLRARLAEIEEGFGDPWDRNNPVGFSALLAADDEGELSVEGVKRYAQLGLNAEFVPAELGGRLVGLDGLGLLMRPMFRRDVTLAMGTALTSFMGSMVVWLNGDAAQCRRTAETLLNGGLATVAFQQLAHGNDFVNDEFRAKRTAAGLAIAGRKAAVNNAETADLLIAFARSGADNAERDDAEGEGARAAPTRCCWFRWPSCPPSGCAGWAGTAPTRCAACGSAAWSSPTPRWRTTRCSASGAAASNWACGPSR